MHFCTINTRNRTPRGAAPPPRDLSIDDQVIRGLLPVLGRLSDLVSLSAYLEIRARWAAHEEWMRQYQSQFPPDVTRPEYQELITQGYYQDEYGNWFDADGNLVQ